MSNTLNCCSKVILTYLSSHPCADPSARASVHGLILRLECTLRHGTFLTIQLSARNTSSSLLCRSRPKSAWDATQRLADQATAWNVFLTHSRSGQTWY